MATKTRKPLQALGLADNFLFGEVMQDMGLCKLFLEALLQRPIAKIVNISKEKDLSDAYLAHGIRLDVDLEDENRTRYNIEMQGSSQKSIERHRPAFPGAGNRLRLAPQLVRDLRLRLRPIREGALPCTSANAGSRTRISCTTTAAMRCS